MSDLEAFAGTLNSSAEARALFDGVDRLLVTRAPGRLDLMGGIADYSGSLVLQLPLREATLAAIAGDRSRRLRIVSLQRPRAFEMPLAELETLDYDSARAYFARDPAQHWAAYAAGAFLALMRERGARFAEGARILISSDVPEGKGVSSSAALEVAVMQAVAVAFGIEVEPREMALLCQKVENLVAGAPCGVMDQMTAVCGQANRLLALLCQPAELQDTVAIPDEIAVWGLDSGVRHAVSGADYTAVRVGAFMGHRIISAAGAEIDCLANLRPSAFEQFYAARLPERILGADFLAEYGGTADTVTRVEPERTYAVRVPTAHPVYENFRVRAFREVLAAPVDEESLGLLGELMYQSHASYSACGLGTAETDLLVELVRAAGPERGIYGAKITGGGSGGTVAVLGRRGAGASVEAVADEYARRTGHRPQIFSGSSSGAAAFGHRRLRRRAGAPEEPWSWEV